MQSLLAESDSDEDGKDKDESSDELLDEELGQGSALDNLDNMDQEQEQEELKTSEYSAEF